MSLSKLKYGNPRGILEDDVREVAVAEARGGEVRNEATHRFRRRVRNREKSARLYVDWKAFVDLLQRDQLRRRQARVGLRTVACQRRGNERAALRIGKDAVAETVESIALRQNGRRDRGKLRCRNGAPRRKRLRVPDEPALECDWNSRAPTTIPS